MQSAAMQQLAAAKAALGNNNQLPLAKASLLASLLKPDPVSVPREEVVQFHIFLDSCLVICSPSNIQICKRWILRHLSSPGRIQALAKYLIALGSSYPAPPPPGKNDSTAPPPMKPSARRRKLHILYLLHDLLYHARYHEPNPIIAEALKPYLADLFGLTVYPGAVKQKRRVEKLLDLWDEKEIFDRAYLETLRIKVFETINQTIVEGAADKKAEEAKKAAATANKPKNLTLPPQHGDPAVPFYDLPAANMIPHIKPNSTQPINARNVKPIQFQSQNPPESTVRAVKDLLGSVSAMYAGEDIGKLESDAVGGTAGEDGEGYYGWSKTFCESMKRKRKEALGGGRGRSREDSREKYGRSRSRSNSAGAASTTHNKVPPPSFAPPQSLAPPQSFAPPQQYPSGNNNSGPTPPMGAPPLPPNFPPVDLAAFQAIQQNIQNLQKNMGGMIPPPSFPMPNAGGAAWPPPPIPPNMLPNNMLPGGLPFPFPLPGLPIPPPPHGQAQGQGHQQQQPNYDPRRDPRARPSESMQPWQAPYQQNHQNAGWKKQ
ncbi:hypothetical protein BJ508DRAFT_95971 [Ascobolus immersus RN42]|uniref:CID domain-containing protein n=1 Tax=Ascobolus immersus RN42 TaxID=1160509 RepID=A0A3N4ILU4_ASCIM|nr:hypothetical protein BJ508DRAFT_95971 [Ascobolus immersus RN42]